jgi:tRNA (guanine37-N1)-methyltransferase
MRIDVVSIFPVYFDPLHLSLVGKAIERGLVELRIHDLREWTHNRHRTVDDTPYGGGPGMVMRPEPWGEVLDSLAPSGAGEVLDSLAPSGGGEVLDSLAPSGGGEVLDSLAPSGGGEVLDSLAGSGGGEVLDSRAAASPILIMPTPSGRPFNQQTAWQLADQDHLIFACGRYEGIDARVVDYAATRMQVEELSIGDYVLAGGEVAALVIIEAVVRLLPGVLGNPESLAEESYSADQEWLLEYPTYTKPPTWRGLEVPEILFSGNHAKIAAWRHEQALARTRDRRPDLRPSNGD